jgi:hypothetical protein
VFLTATAAIACGGGNAASSLAKPPEFAPEQAKCGVTKSQARPLVVEWASSDRLELETKARKGIVAVKYRGCDMDVLEQCTVPGNYRYTGGTRKEDRVVMKDADDLYANLPVGALKLESKLQRSGQLTVAMNLVGRYEAERESVRADELKGDCAGATHFVYGVTVGAFDFYAGGEAEVGGGVAVAGVAGAGGHSKSEREDLSKDGDVAACAKATTDDKKPPEGCGALIRLEVVPLAKADAASAGVPKTPALVAPQIATTATALAGGEGGGPMSQECPAGENIVGLFGRKGPFFYQVGVLCGRFTAWKEGRAAFERSSRQGPIGQYYADAAEWSLACPPDGIVTAISVGTVDKYNNGRFVGSVNLECSPVVRDGVSWRVDKGNMTEEVTSPSIVDRRRLGCEAGAATALTGRAGAWVDALGLRCGAPSLAAPP